RTGPSRTGTATTRLRPRISEVAASNIQSVGWLTLSVPGRLANLSPDSSVQAESVGVFCVPLDSRLALGCAPATLLADHRHRPGIWHRGKPRPVLAGGRRHPAAAAVSTRRPPRHGI